MKYILFFTAFVFTLGSFAQERAFYGKIIDKDKKNGIPFCVIQLKEINDGRYSDEQGRFSFTVYSDSVKTLAFYCMGYERKEVNIKDLSRDSMIIELQSVPHSLNEVAVTTRKAKTRYHG